MSQQKVASKPCDVCGTEGDGAHFGAYACRACAAFFRRTVSMNKAYQCHYEHQCRIQSDVRSLCRACRYAKCILVGMETIAVQPKRDSLGKTSSTVEANSEPQPGPSYSNVDSAVITLDRAITLSSTEPTPILTRMNYHFNALEQVRRIVHVSEGDNIFKRRPPRPILYKEIHDIHKKEIPLISDWVVASFPEYETLPAEQKRVLFQNFFLSFGYLEGGYSCVQRDTTTIMFFSTGDYIDFSNPMQLFDDEEKLSAHETAELFRSTGEIYQRNVMYPMYDHKVTRMEFLYLASMVLWDRGVPGQSRECEDLAVQLRDKLTKELMTYYDQCMPNVQPVMRIANLLMVIPNIQRMVQRSHVDLEMSSIFGLFSLEKDYCDFVQGRQPLDLTRNKPDLEVLKRNTGGFVHEDDTVSPKDHTTKEIGM